METTFDKIKLIKEVLNGTNSQFDISFRALRDFKGQSAQLNMLIEITTKLLEQQPFARCERDEGEYNSLDGYTFRLFNGSYYEKVCSTDISRCFFDWFKDNGVSSDLLLKFEHKLDKLIVREIRIKSLRPRLTLMCFTNGVVDFEEKKPVLMPFDSKYDVIKQYKFDYDPSAINTCRMWKDFLGEPIGFVLNDNGVLPEKMKRRMLQMFLGSMLIDRKEHSFEYFMILQGTGGNGKSVIFRVLEGLLGSDEISSLDLSQFSRGGDERLRAAANLEGKRLMYCPEENIKSLKNIQFIKSIASGESQPMRRIKGNIGVVDVPPIIMFNTNHRWRPSDFMPSEDLNDDSMTRRVQIVNFERTIPVGARDTGLHNRLLEEASGIFAWIVKGYMELRKNKYRMPESVQGRIDLALEKARAKVEINGQQIEGIVALYLERKCVSPEWTAKSLSVDVTAEELYSNFMAFCTTEGLDSVTQNKFGRDLTTIGFEKEKKEKNNGGDGKYHYTMYCTDPVIAGNFRLHVPTVVDEVKAKIFEGEDYTEDEFNNDFK